MVISIASAAVGFFAPMLGLTAAARGGDRSAEREPPIHISFVGDIACVLIRNTPATEQRSRRNAVRWRDRARPTKFNVVLIR